MKCIVVLTTLVACVLARPSHVLTPAIAYHAVAPAVVAPVEVSSQYHSQDNLGQYNYGYSSGTSAKAESRSIDGVTSGAYSYVDPEGKIQNVQYTADPVHGFRVAASNLPIGPSVPEAPVAELPQPVQDTPEVAEAKSAHLKTVEEVKARHAAAAEEHTSVAVNTVDVHPVVHTIQPVHTPIAYTAHIATPVQYAVPVPYSAFSYAHNSVHTPAISYAAYPYYGYNTLVHPVVGVPSNEAVEVEAKKA